MSGSLFFFLNGRPLTLAADEAFETLANFLRYRLAATGTKIVCDEGDCGACSVLVGRPEGNSIAYRPINSCIQFLYQLHGTHIVTVEGLKVDGRLHPVQESMIRCHGAQCGYCTPGFIVAMCAMYESSDSLTDQSVRDGLTGNLCRCTGYEPIIKAALAVDPATVRKLNDLYPPETMLARLREHGSRSLLLETESRRFLAPATLEEALRFKSENPGTIIVQGGTDIAVQHNKRGYDPPLVMNLSNVASFGELAIENGVAAVGATVSLTRLEEFFRERVPQFHAILDLFGGPQIKHAGTLAGNIANASPIADSLPFLYVTGAQVELSSTSGSRLVPIDSFYLGYKKLDLRADELITRILIPLPGGASREILKLYKISKRKNLDISTMTAAIRVQMTGRKIEQVRIAYGGVAPTVVRLLRTEEFLSGKEFTLEAFRHAGDVAREEVKPISDVRGSAAFRRQLAGNVLLKFYYETASAVASAA